MLELKTPERAPTIAHGVHCGICIGCGTRARLGVGDELGELELLERTSSSGVGVGWIAGAGGVIRTSSGSGNFAGGGSGYSPSRIPPAVPSTCGR